LTSPYIQRLRTVLGHDLLLLPAVAVVLHDSTGRLLLVRSAATGEWGLPAGAVDPGESPAAAARRELWEEAGIDAGELKLVAAVGGSEFRHRYPNGDEVEYSVMVFAGNGSRTPAPRDSTEVSEAMFFSRETAPPLRVPYPVGVLWPE
jgi:8-oxo-dGTP pyrophosphatase MutT (NUDIX family)